MSPRAFVVALAVALAPSEALAIGPVRAGSRVVDVQVGDDEVRVMYRVPVKELGLPPGANEDDMIAAAKGFGAELAALTAVELDDAPLGQGRVLDTKLAMGAEPRADILLSWPEGHRTHPAQVIAVGTPANSPGPDGVSIFERHGKEKPFLLGASTIQPGGRYATLLGSPAPDYSGASPAGSARTFVPLQGQPGAPKPEAPASRGPWFFGLALLALSLGSLALWRRDRRRA